MNVNNPRNFSLLFLLLSMGIVTNFVLMMWVVDAIIRKSNVEAEQIKKKREWPNGLTNFQKWAELTRGITCLVNVS